MDKDQKILQEIKEQNQKIMELVVKQNQDSSAIIGKLEKHDEQFEKINGRFDRIESAVLDSSKDIKEIKKTLDTAVTNHESRIRRLEAKAGV